VVTCAADHNAIKADAMLWALLPYVGVYPGIPDDDFGPGCPPLELRNCACGSTLARPMSEARR
jgi:hypothetical protein